MTDILKDYDPIALSEMGGIRLMNRTDTKYVTTEQKLRLLLRQARDQYYVQDIDGRRMAEYYTLYFDTEGCDMFRAHHNGKLNRQKLRIRSYADSDLNFLEVKTKNNHRRTKKKRIALERFDCHNPSYDDVAGVCSGESVGWNDFLSANLGYDTAHISAKVENHFCRITLVNKGKTERLTIDTGLRFVNVNDGTERNLGGLVIIELKRDGLVPSPIEEMLLNLRIKPMGFSKYCMGMAMTYNNIRKNRFMPRLTKIGKLLAVEREALMAM